MSVKQIRIFTDYAIRYNHWRSKKEMLQLLKKDMASETPPQSTLRFLIVLSSEGSHSHPIVPMQLHQKLHPDLVNEIRNLVQNGICTVRSIKSHLLEYVKAMFLNSDVKPDPSNCCYYPTNKIIYNHMRKSMAEHQSQCDNEAESTECTEQWVEIITSSPSISAQHNEVVSEDVSESEPIEGASGLVFELVKVSASSEVIELQQSCKKELLNIDKLLHMCVDENYLQTLLTNLEHLTNCTKKVLPRIYNIT